MKLTLVISLLFLNCFSKYEPQYIALWFKIKNSSKKKSSLNLIYSKKSDDIRFEYKKLGENKIYYCMSATNDLPKEIQSFLKWICSNKSIISENPIKEGSFDFIDDFGITTKNYYSVSYKRGYLNTIKIRNGHKKTILSLKRESIYW